MTYNKIAKAQYEDRISHAFTEKQQQFTQVKPLFVDLSTKM